MGRSLVHNWFILLLAALFLAGWTGPFGRGLDHPATPVAPPTFAEACDVVGITGVARYAEALNTTAVAAAFEAAGHPVAHTQEGLVRSDPVAGVTLLATGRGDAWILEVTFDATTRANATHPPRCGEEETWWSELSPEFEALLARIDGAGGFSHVGTGWHPQREYHPVPVEETA